MRAISISPPQKPASVLRAPCCSAASLMERNKVPMASSAAILVLLALVQTASSGCVSDPPTVTAQLFASNKNKAEYALHPGCDLHSEQGARWVGPDNTIPAGFTLEYAEDVTADGFYLRNSNNYGAKDKY